ncbi:VanZ family protein [Sideroxydans lithotrophicus]|uniref:VanZ family protein n=1 Tax=Sideroxydans lithotrophicus (strain ES-1) TaxID=580332 RepID=D5CPQ1_SIDLE|nr:VanZ family protein [Sideroxydans lithotrophicus]ADE13046.1 VanZ family protein [Sideroxydans lithotrophicus ES-1]
MSTSLPDKPRSLLRRYLVAGYAVFIIYASLTPFTGWEEQGLEFWAVLTSPLGLTYTGFDALSNLLAYFPFGLLLALTFRTYFGNAASVLLATLAAVSLSVAMEYLQMYLPMRTSSNADILSNSCGSLCGGLLAVSIKRRAWFVRVTQWRIGLFRQGNGVDFGLALVMLWMFAQINPSLPMLGNVFITEPAYRMFIASPPEPFSPWESLAVALNLLMVGTLLLTLLRTRRHVAVGLMLMLGIVALVKFIAAALLLKSWALLLWLNSEAILGIVIGLLLITGAAWLPPPRLIWATALAALSYVILANWVLDSGTPSAAMRLYHWHFGHLRNYNGLSHTVSLVFPLLLGGYLWWARASYKQERE